MRRPSPETLVLLLAACGLVAAAVAASLRPVTPPKQGSPGGQVSSADELSRPGPEGPARPSIHHRAQAQEAHEPPPEDATHRTLLPEEAPPEAGPLVRVGPARGGVIGGLEVQIGAPGLYPPVERTTDAQGRVVLPRVPAATLAGQPVQTYEIYAGHGQDRYARAFWGDLTLEEGAEDAEAGGHRLNLWDAAPLELSVTGPKGQPVTGARARLGRSVVALVQLEARADEAGIIRFDQIPAGEYVATVSAPGFLSQEVPLEQIFFEEGEGAHERATWGVMLERGRSVYGQVVDASGRGVPEAFVTAYVDRWGGPRELAIESFDHIEAMPPRGIAVADLSGYFSISDLPAGVVYLTAESSRGIPGMSAPIDMRELQERGPVQLLMAQGGDVEVEVVGPDGEPVEGARVSWRDESNGLSSRTGSDADGIALFEDVPPGARFVAELDGWSSPGHVLEAPDWDGVYRLRARLEPPGTRQDWSFRLGVPEGVIVEALSWRPGEGVRCQAVPMDRDDWRVEDCAQGAGWLEVVTRDHGERSWQVTLEDAGRAALAPPEEVTVTVRGWPGEEARRLGMTWRSASGGGPATPVALQAIDRRASAHRWTHRLYPGAYELELTGPEGRAWERRLRVGPSGAELEWEPEWPDRARAFVVDHRQHPVRGAWMELWKGGERVETFYSGGRAPVMFEQVGLEGARLIALDPSRGAGAHELTAEDLGAPEVVLTLSRGVLTPTGRPDEVTDREVIERVLGAGLVADDERWLIDVRDPDSPAARAGIPRGAQLVGVRRGDQGVEVLYAPAQGEAITSATLGE